MKVFLSSVITGFEPIRSAAVDAIRLLRHEVIRAEDFPASASSPQRSCLDGVHQSDLVVLVLGERYGEIQASGKSATHEEFQEAAGTRPVLAFVQSGVDREPDMQRFVTEVQDWLGGALTASFSTPAELRDEVTRALSEHAVGEAAGRVNDEEMVARAVDLIPSSRNASGTRLVVSVSGGPAQPILRPTQIESDELCRTLKQGAMFGAAAVLDSDLGARCEVRGDVLHVFNDNETVIVDPLGSVVVSRPAKTRSNTFAGIDPLIEEDVFGAIEASLRFVGQVLDSIDSAGRLKAVAPVAAILGSPMGWRTKAEQAASPNAMSMGFGGSGGALDPVRLSPATRPRRHLIVNATELAEDLGVLLRRQVQNRR